jgi:putative hydrolase of the HAD superfamily
MMQKSSLITCAFVDIGGVLLTDGWDRQSRKRAAKHFRMDLAAMEERHHLTWDTYQAGKLTMNEYLELTVFFQKRVFSRAQFRRFMFAQSKPYPDMIQLVTELKLEHGLKIVVISNEGRELNAYRVRKFRLDRIVDSFVSSCFVHLLKPDADIFRLALDIAQTPARQVVYIENTPMFVRIAEGLGIRSILHTGFASTRKKLNSFGLLKERAIHEIN